MSNKKSILLLQDPTGTFFRRLYKDIKQAGHKVYHINLGPADFFYWLGIKSTNYWGSLANWPIFLDAFIQQHDITDIIYNQDRFPYHMVAIELAEKKGIRAFACENGYLRPDWITFEKTGMSTMSHFPKDPDMILKIAKELPNTNMTVEYPYPFLLMAFHEVLYHLLNVFFFFLFPKFSQYRYYHPLAEYLRMIPRLFMVKKRNKAANQLIKRLSQQNKPYFIFPLQLQSDYQIHYHSPFEHIAQAVEITINSFAQHAPKHNVLVFKLHPYEPGIDPWHKIIMTIANKYQIATRIKIIDGGNLDSIVQTATGLITINSTSGLHAIKAACPTKVLGIAVYDINGLTSMQPIDEFWQSPQKPNSALYEALEKTLTNSIQIKGNLYTQKGKQAASRGIIEQVTNQPSTFTYSTSKTPTRLSKALAAGVSVLASTPEFSNLWKSKWKSYLNLN